MINKHQLDGWVAARYLASIPLDAELRSGVDPMNAGSTERSVLANTAPMVSGERRMPHWKSMRDLCALRSRPSCPAFALRRMWAEVLRQGRKTEHKIVSHLVKPSCPCTQPANAALQTFMEFLSKFTPTRGAT